MIYGGLSFTNGLGRLRIVARKRKRGGQRKREIQQHEGDQDILLLEWVWSEVNAEIENKRSIRGEN